MAWLLSVLEDVGGDVSWVNLNLGAQADFKILKLVLKFGVLYFNSAKTLYTWLVLSKPSWL